MMLLSSEIRTGCVREEIVIITADTDVEQEERENGIIDNP